jgi:hypothetical protein
MNRAVSLATALIACVALIPLLLPMGYMFDSEGHAMFFFTQDPAYLENIISHGWYVMYALFLGFNKLALTTGIPPKVFFNILGVVSILGLAREMFVYLRRRFDFTPASAMIGAWAVLAFPVWHVLMSCVFTSHAMCIWLFMLSINLWHRRSVLALPIFLVSLNLFSLFALAVGVAGVEFIMTVRRETFVPKALRSVLFGCGLVALYMVATSFINVHGHSGQYNTFNLDRLVSFLNFGVMAVIVLGLWYAAYGRKADKALAERTLRLALSFLALSFFAGLAYWAVGRPMRYLTFGSFTGRHALLTAIPFSLLMATGAECVAARWGVRVMRWVTGFILAVCVVVLYQGYDHKAAALLFKDMLVHSLRQVEEPPSGYVSIAESGYKAPRHVHQFSINMCLYRAYGRGAWMANGFWAKRGHVYSREDLVKMYDAPARSRKLLLAFEVAGDAFTRYDFVLENYHQEGRTWYWYNYVFNDFSPFNPRLVKLDVAP